ncbi:hypothetical protein LXM50_06835 [Microbacterium sp. Au-Mic1]|uniref:hypothetical protein n=1 Tax=Microbacterium sp. Au-Mic1 TaxID=2906457 RepID=UPI001E461E17|nr:hypothetical protein [Microbacterium sp. Au-Mic1]MCE4025684.1 hypothetical protein [Microbacterium sp. Au-Mic1]
MTGHAPGPVRAHASRRWMIGMLAIAAVFLSALVPAVTDAAPAVAAPPSTSVVAAGGSGTSAATSVRPMTLDGWNAGNIISDAVFTNKSTMSAQQIQDFFNAKVPSCQSGYTCLKDFRVTSQNRPADSYCQGYSGVANESAASIIYRVSQSCNINPQVLIVMLQKEQGLVTHTWPSGWRYDSALGQGCPDDAPCDPTYVGFFQQIYGAARQMQIYMEGRWFTWYAPGNTWNILYNPNTACGSGPVYIANKATSALYYYTPYQPNASALRAGYGEGDACGAYGNRNFYNYFTDWFGSTQGGSSANNPTGNIESVSSVPGQIRVTGWALDPDTSDSIDVHVYVNGVGYPSTAKLARPDLAPFFPKLGINHGFDISVPPTVWGAADVCVYGINRGAGTNQLFGCTTVTSYGGSPVGTIDSLTSGPGTVSVRGWAFDPDTKDPIAVHVYVGGAGYPTTANQQRTDVGAAFPVFGSAHGYQSTVTAPAGYQTVCVYGINVASGSNVLLMPCRQIFVPPATDPGTAPIGRVDAFIVKGDQVTVAGWTLDPDTNGSIPVHVYVGSSGAAYQADLSRGDIAAAFPGYGDAHGFAVQRTLPPGGAQVCAYGINNGRGANTMLGCQFVAPTLSAQPFGNFESAVAVSGGVQVSGWAIDPDTTAPIAVHFYIDGVGVPRMADQPRPDVGAAYPSAGAQHGFATMIPAGPSSHTVCAYAINDAPGNNPLLGCRSF